MSRPTTILLNKLDLKESIAHLKKEQKMIDLPIFAALRNAIEQRLVDEPDLVIADIRFEEPGPEPDLQSIQAVVYFKTVS